MPFFIIFVIIPLVEIMVFMIVGEHIGLGTTLFLALLTAIIGGAIVRHQGLRTLMEIRNSASQGVMPMGELFDGACLIAAGATLITPGFVTDTIGFLLLIPAVRAGLKGAIKAHMNVTEQHTSYHTRKTRNDVIEGEFEIINEDEQKTGRNNHER